MYMLVEKWLNKILEQNIPSDVVGLNFNLYEDGSNNWSIELIGTDRFDLEDEAWCCEEIFDFGTRETPFVWKEEKTWDEILDQMMQIIKKYLEQGLYSSILKQYQGIGIGFVDGDVEMLFVK